MSYEKQTWATGDVITAEKLNHMEDGIETNSNDVERLSRAVGLRNLPIIPVDMVYYQDRTEITLPFDFYDGYAKTVELYSVIPDAPKEYIGTFELFMTSVQNPEGYKIELTEYPIIYYDEGFKVSQQYGESELSADNTKFVFLSQLAVRTGAIQNVE